MKHSIDCVGFKPLSKGTLVGFADIMIRELKLTIHDVGLHEKGTSRWATTIRRPPLKTISADTEVSNPTARHSTG